MALLSSSRAAGTRLMPRLILALLATTLARVTAASSGSASSSLTSLQPSSTTNNNNKKALPSWRLSTKVRGYGSRRGSKTRQTHRLRLDSTSTTDDSDEDESSLLERSSTTSNGRSPLWIHFPTCSLSTPKPSVTIASSSKKEKTSSRAGVGEKWLVLAPPTAAQEATPGSKNGTTPTSTVAIRPSARPGTLNLKVSAPAARSSPTKDDSAGAVAVEGLFGIYNVPSGQLWVWIEKSDPVYTLSPPSTNGTTEEEETSSPVPPAPWQIRRVQSLYLVHVPRHHKHASSRDKTPSSATEQPTERLQRQEERRQFHLLRQALKDHQWYFCPSWSAGDNSNRQHHQSFFPVPDMTRKLQDCWEQQQQQQNENDETGKNAFANWWRKHREDDKKYNAIHNNSLNGAHDDNEEDTTTDPSSPLSTWYPDSRFFWNEAALEPLVTLANQPSSSVRNKDSAAAAKMLLTLEAAIPLTSAFVGVEENLAVPAATPSKKKNDNSATTTTALEYDHLLITRRSRYRAGTRFTRRGADAEGHVANYAETEQVIVCRSPGREDDNDSSRSRIDRICSHVQTRGSVPLRWSSPTAIQTYRPRVRIGTDPLTQARAVRDHLADEAERYIRPRKQQQQAPQQPGLVLVNLIDKKSDQGRLGRALDAVMKAVLDIYEQSKDADYPHLTSKWIRHIWYDFHAQVKGGKWHRLKSLLEDVKPMLSEHLYFEVSHDSSSGSPGQAQWTIRKRQSGVIRTNCMDCLDRTNVVQSIFARFVLFSKLSRNLPLAHKAAFRRSPMQLPWDEGEDAHRYLWADNADVIACLYAGTPALKGDFTRTGKRTKKGALDDGMNSLQRYYLNNFVDAERQEGIDLLVQNQDFTIVTVNEDENSMSKSDGNRRAPPYQPASSIREAALQLLRGAPWQSSEPPADIEGDSTHVRIKHKDKSKKSSKPVWLPGELHNKVREQVLSKETGWTPEDFTEMEQRAAREIPWWVSSAETIPERLNTVEENSHGRIPNGPGFLLAALFAGGKAPLATAAAVVVLHSLSMIEGSGVDGVDKD